MNNDLKRKKLFVLDMDGTIYLDETPIDGAREFISTARRHGVRIVYFTNNASKSISMYYDRLRRLGFEADDGDVVSSADVTIDFIKRHQALTPRLHMKSLIRLATSFAAVRCFIRLIPTSTVL